MSDTNNSVRLFTFDDHLREVLRDDEARRDWAAEEAVIRLARRLYRERTSRGLSQATLADRIGTKQPNISDIENGAANPTVRTLGRIAHALDVDVAGLLRGDDRFGVFGPPMEKKRVQVSSHDEAAGSASDVDKSWREALKSRSGPRRKVSFEANASVHGEAAPLAS